MKHWLVLMPAFWLEVHADWAVKSFIPSGVAALRAMALSQEKWGVASERGRQALIEK